MSMSGRYVLTRDNLEVYYRVNRPDAQNRLRRAHRRGHCWEVQGEVRSGTEAGLDARSGLYPARLASGEAPELAHEMARPFDAVRLHALDAVRLDACIPQAEHAVDAECAGQPPEHSAP